MEEAQCERTERVGVVVPAQDGRVGPAAAAPTYVMRLVPTVSDVESVV